MGMLIGNRADMTAYLDTCLKGYADKGADLITWADEFGLYKGVRGIISIRVERVDHDTYAVRFNPAGNAGLGGLRRG